jgi:putative oxidoreductase
MENTCTLWAPRILGVLRIVTGYLFFWHGSAKLFGIPHVPMFDNLQIMSLVGLAGIIEVVFGFLVFIGLFTRFSAFIASGMCAAAYFIGHVATQGQFFLPMMNGGEAAVLFSFIFFYIIFAGPGAWSIDGLRKEKTH